MAEVFLASMVGAEGFSRKVAIKRVLPGFSDNEAFAKMFVAEAQISSQLVHPNIVSVLDFDRDADNRLFLVMELVEGKDLDELVQTGLLPIPVVIYVIAEVLRGLGYAHDLPVGTHVRGVVHRDISPHNVLVSWEGAVKVSDFGIAKARAASAATASEFIKGKPAYMSPEQANGQPLDGRSDLFAVGIMLWEMLVGRRLFIGEDTRATLAAVLFGQMPRPRALRGDVPKDLERVTMKLLERDLPARYATAEQAIDELLDCADAPKAGRELLTTTLAERFAAEAPVRHSQRRVRSQPAVNRSPGAPSGTMPDGAPARHATPLPLAVGAAAMPSLGSVRNAPTATIDPGAAQPPVGAYPHPPAGARPGQTRKLLLAAAVLVITAFASFAIVSAVSGRDSQGRGSGGDGPGSQLASLPPPGPDAAPALPGPDAAPATVAPIPPDAAPAPEAPDAGTPDAAKKRPVERVKMGKLSVLGGRPVVAVYWRGRKIGETPLVGYELPAGRHTIALRRQGPEVNFKDRDIPVTIQADQLTTVKQ